MYLLRKIFRKSAHICLGILILSSNGFSHTSLQQPKVYFLAEEQSFLEQVYLDQWRFKTGSWKMQDKTHWILDVSEFKYIGKNEPVRFIMTQATNYPDQWLLYALEQENGQWIGRYGSIPVAAFKKNQTGKWDTTLIPNLTATNLIATLKSKNLAYFDDRNQKIKQVGEMCASKIDNNVNHRRLVEDIFNVEKPSRRFTEAEYNLYLGNNFHTSSLVELNQRSASNNIYGGIYGDMSFQEAFIGSTTRERWGKHFSTPTEDGLTSETINNPVYKKAKKEMVDAFIKNQTYTRIEIMKAIPEFNNHVYAVNKICKELKPKYAEAENMPVYFADKEDSYAVKKMSWELQAKKNATKNYLQSLADMGAKIHLDFLSHGSKLAALWQSKDFENQVGHFDAKDCSKGGSELGFISSDTVDAAIKEINQQNLAALNKNTKISTQKFSSPDVLKTYILSSPYSVQSAIQQTKSLNDAVLACKMIREVYDDDQFDLYFDRGLMAVGLAAGFTVGALTGADLIAPAVAPYVMLGTDAIFLMRGSYQWYDGYYLDKNVRDAMGARQIGQQQALNTLSEAQQKQTAGKTTIAMTLGGNVVGYGVGKGVQAYKKSKILAQGADDASRVKIEPTTPPVKLEVETTPSVVEKPATQDAPVVPKIAAGGIQDFKIERLASGVTKSGERVEAFYHTASNINGKNDSFMTIDIFGLQSGILKERARVITSVGHFPNEVYNVKSLIFQSKNKFYMAKFKEGSAEVIELGQYSKPYEFEVIPGEYGPGNLVLHNNELIKYTSFGRRDLGLVVRSDGTIEGVYDVVKNGTFNPESIQLKQFVKDAPENKLLGQQMFESDNIDVTSLDDGYLVLYPNSTPVFIDKYGRIAEGTLKYDQAIFKMPEGTTTSSEYIKIHSTNILPAETRKFSKEILGEYRALHFRNTPIIGQWHTGPKEDMHNISLIDGFELPTAPNGPLCGTGSLNCTGHAMAMDSFLNKGPAMGVMRDATYLPDFIDHNLFSTEGKLLHPTTPYHVQHVTTYMNAVEAAGYFASKVETFETLPAWIERLNKLPEGGTAVIFEQAPPIPVVTNTHITYSESSYTHVFNVKKLDGEIIFFDSQQGLVTQYSQTILANPKAFKEVDMIETTQFHQNSLAPLPLSPIAPKTTPSSPATGPQVNKDLPINHSPSTQPEIQASNKNTALIPYLDPKKSEEQLKHISEILAFKPEQKGNWNLVTITYETRNIPPHNLNANVIAYDLQNQRLLLNSERNYHDFFWVDTKDISIKKLALYTEKIPLKFFNTEATFEFKIFRERFLNQKLQKGDLIDIGKDKPLSVESQRGIIVVVRESDGTLRRMTKTELEKASLHGPAQQTDDYLNDILASTKFEVAQKEFATLALEIDRNAQILLDELAYYDQHLLRGNQTKIPTEIYERIRNFEATKADLDIAWLHNYNADTLHAAYENLTTLNHQILLQAEKLVQASGYGTKWVVTNNRLMLEIVSTPDKELLHTTFLNQIKHSYYDPFSGYFRSHQSETEFYFNDIDLLNLLEIK
jgi:hypothetical protein